MTLYIGATIESRCGSEEQYEQISEKQRRDAGFVPSRTENRKKTIDSITTLHYALHCYALHCYTLHCYALRQSALRQSAKQ